MREKSSDQMRLDFNPISKKTTETVALMEEVVQALPKKLLTHVEVCLTIDVNNPEAGRRGMSANQVLRMALIKQMYQFSYRDLQARVEDSILLRSFADYEFTLVPSSSALQANIKAVDAETWEQINTALIKIAIKRGIDTGKKLRIDTTSVETLIHHPTDSSLLWDGVRVLTRLMLDARKRYPEAKFEFHNRTRICKKLNFKIASAKSLADSREEYLQLIKYAEEVVRYATGATKSLRVIVTKEEFDLSLGVLAEKIAHYTALLRKVIDQSKRRIIKREKVPANEKVVSLFEEHTDILEKGKRETAFGHKVNLTAGDSSLIWDCEILEGNPVDSDLLLDAVKSFRKKYRKVPDCVATDKGFGSTKNAEDLKEFGVKEITFSKRRLPAHAQALMAEGAIEKMLIRFRAGVESVISAAKRGVNLSRCLWRGWDGFCAYVWSAITAHNLKMIVAALR